MTPGVAARRLTVVPLATTAAARTFFWVSLIALMLSAALVGVYTSGQSPKIRSTEMPPSVRRAIEWHNLFAVEGHHVVEVPAEQQPHLSTWLSNRSSENVRALDLRNQGLVLLGGRVARGDKTVAAMLVYEGKEEERISLFIQHLAPPKDTSFQYIRQGGVGAIYWQLNDALLILVGPSDNDRLRKIAGEIYELIEDRAM